MAGPGGSLRKLAGQALILRVLAALVTYGFVVGMARMMSVADFGVLGVIMSLALIASVVGALGQRLALLRFVPPLLAAQKPTRPLISAAFRLAMIGNGCVYLLLLAGVLLRGQDVAVLALGLLIVPLTAAIDMQGHLGRAYKSLSLALVPKDILWRLLSGLVVALIWLNTGEPVSVTAVFTILIAVLIGLIWGQGVLLGKWFGLVGIWRLMRPPRKDDQTDLSEWQAARGPLWLTSVASILFASLDVVIVGLMFGAAPAAIYFAANRVATVLGLFQQSVGVVVAPLMSEHAASGARAELGRVVGAAVIQMMLPASVVGLGICFLAPWILGLFGADYVGGIYVLWALVLGRLVSMGFGDGQRLLTMAGQERRAMILSGWSLVFGIALILCCGLLGQGLGVAIGTGLALSLRQGLFWMACKRALNLRPDIVSALRGRVAID